MLSDPAEANCTCMPGFYGQLCEKGKKAYWHNAAQATLKTWLYAVGDNCWNDSKRFIGAYFNNSAIILKLICPEKTNLYFKMYFVQKQTYFPFKTVGGAQGTSSQMAKFRLHVVTTEVNYESGTST